MPADRHPVGTHEAFNQPAALANYNAYLGDAGLQATLLLRSGFEHLAEAFVHARLGPELIERALPVRDRA